MTISTSLCRWPGGERLVWLGPNLPLCRGPQRQKVKRFTGETRRKPNPRTRPERSEEGEASPAPRARQAARGGRSSRLEGGLLGVRVDIIVAPRIQWLTIICEAKHMRAAKLGHEAITTQKRAVPGFVFVQSQVNPCPDVRKLVLVVVLEVVGDCGQSCRLSSTPRSDRSPGDRSWA